MLSFFPLDVLDEIWDLTESFFEGFLTYFYCTCKDICLDKQVIELVFGDRDPIFRGGFSQT